MRRERSVCAPHSTAPAACEHRARGEGQTPELLAEEPCSEYENELLYEICFSPWSKEAAIFVAGGFLEIKSLTEKS